LQRLRLARGWSQLRLATQLCDVSGTATVSRHEVSRWEREERVPSSFWRQWLAVVLQAPLEQLEAAAAAYRRRDRTARQDRQLRLWRGLAAPDLLAALDHGGVGDIQQLAHAWLAGPPDPVSPGSGYSVGAAAAGSTPCDGTCRDTLGRMEARLGRLRRMDDIVGGLDLAGIVERELRQVIAALPAVGDGRQRARALGVVAGHAQLAGWVHADAGDYPSARRAYRVALQAAAGAGDRPLAAYILAALSHQSLAAQDPQEALLLARTGMAGLPDGPGCALTRVLLLHRTALAAAQVGNRPEAQAALMLAERLADRPRPDEDPQWLYWLTDDELAAMTGRCLAVLGRPLRAARLLSARAGGGGGPRSAALYGVWLARVLVALGEVEEACQVASRALLDAVSGGSARAVDSVRHLHPVLLRHRDLPAVRVYEVRAEAAFARMADALPKERRS
jgi:transcriptional regulator with XRE-family HTH domain